jgi:hypothetical protein
MICGMKASAGHLSLAAAFRRPHRCPVIEAGRACSAMPTYARPATSMLDGNGSAKHDRTPPPLSAALDR